MSVLRILLADDHDLIRRGLKGLLAPHPGWQICGEAQTGREAVAKAEELKPDVAILDISMPELDGLAAARRIRKLSPNTEILILSMHYSDELVRETLDAGARGYILKFDSDRDLVTAVEALANHKHFFTPSASEVVSSELDKARGTLPRSSKGVKERLTTREREIVRILADGKSSKEVASALGISVKTVETHRTNIMRKLQVHSLSGLVRYAVRNKIVEP